MHEERRRLIPLGLKDGRKEFYVLVSGLSSGEWWYWGKRWKSINGHLAAHGGSLFSSRRRRGARLSSVLYESLNETKFDVLTQFGARLIKRRRTLEVDEDGFPLGRKTHRNQSDKK